ncbi:hypothetical protein HYS03_00130 [Candidatus Woesebacteria bacterium]|nr:hypothetical protein [Candidatus Woesebacteria bacterium]
MRNKIIATVVVISLLSVVTPALAWHGQLSITVDCNGGSARVTPVPSSDVVEQSVSSSSWSWGGKNSITVSGHIKWHYQRNGKWVDEVWNGSQVATKPNGCSTPPSTSTTPASTLTQPSPTQPSIWSPGWAACDWNEKDVPAEQMNDWLFRCSPKQEVTAAKPKVNDCSVQDMILAQVRNGSQTDIWIYRPGVEDGKGAFKVTWKPELKGQNVNASFSPNGCKIVLSNTGRLFVVSIDGSSVERITNTGKDIQPNWASDWSIYFVRKDILTVTDQWGKKPTSLSVSGFLPHASPDAKQDSLGSYGAQQNGRCPSSSIGITQALA